MSISYYEHLLQRSLARVLTGTYRVEALRLFGAAITADVGNGFDRFKTKGLLGLRRHSRQLPAIDDLVGDLMGDDEMRLGSTAVCAL